MKLCPACNSQIQDNQEVPELVPIGYHEDALALSIKRRIAAEEKLRWIPVSERLPTKKDADRLGRVLSYNSYMDWVDTFSWHGVEHSDSVTHWMPLPAPPEMTREEAGHWMELRLRRLSDESR